MRLLVLIPMVAVKKHPAKVEILSAYRRAKALGT
jgi:hypothetical protein